LASSDENEIVASLLVKAPLPYAKVHCETSAALFELSKVFRTMSAFAMPAQVAAAAASASLTRILFRCFI
jgi:hypothetical protein